MNVVVLPLVMKLSLLTPSAFRWYIYFKIKINTEARLRIQNPVSLKIVT